MPNSSHTLTIPSSTQHLREVRRFVEEHARAAGLPRPIVDEIKIAVDEACTNIIKHAYAGSEDQEVEVELTFSADRLEVCLRDQGEPFDPSSYEEPDLVELTRRRRGGGLGVHIMRRCMDKVHYTCDDGYNEVCLTKYLNGNPAS